MYLPQTGARRQQRGSYMLWMLILIPIIFGWLGLSIDAGYAFSEKSRAQFAADAAAIAAVLTLSNHRSYSEVKEAAESALADNGFIGTVIVGNDENHKPTEAQSDFFCEDCPGYNEKYVGVTVTTQSPLFINTWYSDGINLTAHAVARAEKAGSGSSCPGIYADSTGKSTDLKGGSDFTVMGGGIYVGVDDGNALFGSSQGANRSVLSAPNEWIELKGGAATAPNSVDYDPQPTDLSQDRETPDQAPSGLVDYPNCVLHKGNFQCDCERDQKGGYKREKNGDYKCSRPEVRANPEAEKTLNAGNYIGGLKISETSDVILAPVGSTEEERSLIKNLYFKMTSGDLTIENSTVSGQNIIIDARGDAGDLNISLDASVMDVTARLYANSFVLNNDSDIIVTVYIGDQDGEGEYFVCGKKPLLIPTLLQ